MQNGLHSYTKYLFPVFISIFLIVSFFQNKRWNTIDVFAHDQGGYYYYLPAFFHHHDLSLKFVGSYKIQDYYNHYWGVPCDYGVANKFPMGVAILELPFFLAAYLTDATPKEEFNEFSIRYEIAIATAGLVYGIAGLFLLRRYLSYFFDELVVSLVLVSICMGTNWYYYTIFEPGMSHVYTFFLFALFMNLLHQWSLTKSNVLLTVAMGLVIGLVILVRPTNIILALLIPLYGLANLKDIFKNIKAIFHRWYIPFIMMVAAFFVIQLQLWYWYHLSGSFYVYTYGTQGFYWADPKIFSGYLSYRKGLLLYSPVLILTFGGLFLRKYYSPQFWAAWIFIALHSYICFSWWTWWYGGGFGARTLIESFVLMAIPLGAFYHWAIRVCQPFVGRLVTIISICLISFGLLKTHQYLNGYIHWDGMNKTTYWQAFLSINEPPGIREKFTPPDYEKAEKGIGR